MEQIKCNEGALSFGMPEGFHVMTREELWDMGRGTSATDWVAKDNGRDRIVNVAWRKIPVFAYLVKTDLKKAIKQTKTQIRRILPNAVMEEDVEFTIGNEKARGFRYTYEGETERMVTEYDLVMADGFYYAFICSGKEKNEKEDHAVFESLLNTVKFS